MPRPSLLASPVSPARLAFTAVTLISAAALAEPSRTPEPAGDPAGLPAGAPRRVVVPTPLEDFATPYALISGTIYLERCQGGCTITRGTNDARAMTSTIPTPGAHTVSEYRNGAGLSGVAADLEWNALVQCMKEVYSPFRVEVTDVKPTDGRMYHLALIAGIPGEIGQPNDVLGVAPLASDCSPQENVISFSFANAHPQIEMTDRVNNLCWTAAQESAHAFGLDHEYDFVSGSRSACNDPMTYRVDCGGQKFFRNDIARCGEFQARPCRCGSNQNSHLKLISVFDEGASIIPPPTVTITLPSPADTQLLSRVGASAGSRRGVSRVELYINGYKWSEEPGKPFGSKGQEDPASYSIAVPPSLPNSIVDVQVRAFDDLGKFTDSQVVTVTKGAPCTSADTCANGQKCEAGKCFWDPPTGQFGDDCTYPQFCVSGICEATTGEPVCTQSCIPGVADSCPSGFSCEQTSSGQSVCGVPVDGGCCSTAGRGPSLAQIALSLLTLGAIAGPWRRRRRPRP